MISINDTMERRLDVDMESKKQKDAAIEHEKWVNTVQSFFEYDYVQNLLDRFSNVPRIKQIDAFYPKIQQIIIATKNKNKLDEFLKYQIKKDKETVDNLFKDIINEQDYRQPFDNKKN